MNNTQILALRAHRLSKDEPKRKRKNPEQQLQNKILKYLFKHPLVTKAWRQNSGKVKTEYGTWFQGAPAGTSDIIGLLGDGRFLAIEVKTPGNKPTKLQQKFLDLVEDSGGVSLCASSLEDVKDRIPPIPR
jgi:hypothetical protein